VAVFLFDSSALVKRYVATEIGSTWVQRVTNPKQPNKIYIAAISGVEVSSDSDLLAAALAEGLVVENPAQHP
jgi:hypothetical protein